NRPGDYYFIIEQADGKPIGTVGLYDINETAKTFNWGRWIVIKGAPLYAAIETTILIYYIGFRILKLEKTLSDVRKNNKNVINFHLSYGAHLYSTDELSIYYEFNADQFPALLKKFKGFHNISLTHPDDKQIQ